MQCRRYLSYLSIYLTIFTTGHEGTSTLVFFGARLLCDKNAHTDAGTLLLWFIEHGAGDDYKFHFEEGAITSGKYCDIQRLSDLLNTLEPTKASAIVDKIYSPLHFVSVKKSISKGDLAKRIESLEATFANIFEIKKDWYNAYKSNLRLNNIEKSSKLLEAWTSEGYKNERPLFFARALLQLLADGQTAKATELLKYVEPMVGETGNEVAGGPSSAGLAIWHLAFILTNLAAQEPKPRVDKARIFTVLSDRYSSLLSSLDGNLVTIVEKVGLSTFKVRPSEEKAGPNPMAFLQQMLSAGPSSGGMPSFPAPKGDGRGGGLDMQMMMNMLNSMQNMK